MAYLATIRLHSMLDIPETKVPEIVLLFSLEASSMYDVNSREGPGIVGVWIKGWPDTGQQVQPLPTAPDQVS